MSRFRFEWPTKAECRAMLQMNTRQAEFHGDRLIAQRRLMPMSTRAERDASRAFALGPSHVCSDCRRFAFPAPTLCFWCRQAGADTPHSSPSSTRMSA